MSSRIWRRLRQVVQLLSLVAFLFLFVWSTYLNPRPDWSDLFYRLDPLVAAAVMLAGRVFVGGLSLALLTVLLTLLFGRVWCGWICPLGTLLEWLGPRQGPERAKPPAESWRKVKYLLLLAILVAALLGNQTLLIFDPITILTRSLTTVVWPTLRALVFGAEDFLYQFENLWGALDWAHNNLVYPLFGDTAAVFALALPLLLFFALLLGLSYWVQRFWCRYLCPLGGLLGLFSRWALVRRQVKESCTACELCSPVCPTGTIDPQRNFASDPAECTVCHDCTVACKRGEVAFRWAVPHWRPALQPDYAPSRKDTLIALGATVAGVALTRVEPVLQQQPTHLIRPPGATETDFEALCIRCGECVRVCPTHGLQPTLVESGWQNVLTPSLVARLGYCNFTCTACGQVCPTGAIPQLSLEEKRHTPMGLARIDRDRCLPWAYNIHCIRCEETCPVSHKAIWLEEVQVYDAQSELITVKRPSVVRELCIGCGICEFNCPMGGEAAIRVFTLTEMGEYLGDDPDYRPHFGRRGGANQRSGHQHDDDTEHNPDSTDD